MFRITAIGQLLVLTSLAGLVHGVEPEDVRISSTEYLVTDQNVVGTTIQLDTTDEGEPQHFEQQGGSVRVAELLIDNGDYALSGGTLAVDEFSMGNPTSDRFEIFNTGSSMLLRAAAPVSLPWLDFNSREGLLRPVPVETIEQGIGPFESLSSNTPHHIRLESSSPVEFETLVLDIGYGGLDSGDVSVTFGEVSDRVMSTSFEQSGGNVQVRGDLQLCVPPSLPISVFDQSEGTYEQMLYEMSGGSLTVGGDFVVGSLGAAPTTFVQSAGTSNIGGTLKISGRGSTVELRGGRMEVMDLVFASDDFAQGGNFILHPDAELVVKREMSFNSSTLQLPGESTATVWLDGALFEVTDGETFSPFPLNLIAAGNEISRIEAFAYDAGGGPTDTRWNTLQSLTIGMDDKPAHAQLVNRYANNWSDMNALYVDTLILTPGSILDLNRLNVYYNHLEMGEGAEMINPSANCEFEEDFGALTPSDFVCVSADAIGHLLSELEVAHGDLNLDGEVGFDDFLVLSGNFDTQVDDYRDGDLTRDGVVGFDDFLELSGNYAATGMAWWRAEAGDWRYGYPNRGASGFAAVPEPDLKLHWSIGLLCLAGFSLASRPAYRTAIVPQSLRSNRDHS